MKKIFLIGILITVTNLVAQSEVQKFRSKYYYMYAMDSEDGKIITPMGKNVELTFDPFFKKYEFTYTDSEGNLIATKLTFIKEAFGNGWLMKDTFGHRYFVYSLLKENRLLCVMEEKVKGLVISFEITNELH